MMSEKYDIIKEALSRRGEKLRRDRTIKDKYISEFVRLLLDGCDYDDGIIFDLNEKYSAARESMGDCFTVEDKFSFIRLLSEKIMEVKGADMSLFSVEKSSLPQTAVYVKNDYSDMAFSLFSKDISGLCAQYAENFEDAAQSVYGGVGACILPFESSDGFQMTGITALQSRYGLCKSAVCRINAGGSDCSFALYTNGYIQDDERTFIDFILNDCDCDTISGIIASSGFFGMHGGDIRQMKTENSSAMLLTREGKMQAQFAMALYLTLETGNCNIGGIYKKII